VESKTPPETAPAATAVEAGPKLPQSPEASPKPAPAPAYVDDIAAVLPPDLIDLKPEDLRVEAEFFESLTRRSQAPVMREPAPWPPPAEPDMPSFATESFASLSSTPVAAQTTTAAPSPVIPSYLTETVDLAPRPIQPSPPVEAAAGAETAVVKTAIEIEHPTILPAGSEIRRVSEVVLPASVVVSWSLFALLGIALSFVAGLLMGQFLWKPH
jgi:hypothetical protein